MKYIKGISEDKLGTLPLVKLSLTNGIDFTETPWAKKLSGGKGFVLQNQALAFIPWPSWGAIIPTISFNFLDMLSKQELTLHPEAFDYYLKEGWIDEHGEGLHQLR